MRTIRASEIGTFLYCKRAWWYLNQGIPSKNQESLAAGGEFHQEHSRKVMQAKLLRLAGWLVLLAAVTLLAVFLTLQLLASA